MLTHRAATTTEESDDSPFRYAAWDRPPTPTWTHPAATSLYFGAVFLIGVQLEIKAFENFVETRLPPGDILLAVSLLLAPTAFRVVRQPVSLLPAGLLLTLGYGLIAAMVSVGVVTQHAFNVKFLGAFVLVCMATVTISYAREGFGPHILRTFVIGAVAAGVVGWIDWRWANVLPFYTAPGNDRFTGLVSDPNNAGAYFGMAALVSLRYGQRLFRTNLTWIVSTLLIGFFLAQTLSRGAMIGTAAALTVMALVDHIPAQRWVRYLAIGSVVVAAVFASGFVDTAIDDFSRRPDNVGGRNSLIDSAMDVWVDSDGVGAGLGTLRGEIDEIVHNTAIWLVSEMSVVGLIYLGASIAIPAIGALRLRALDNDLGMALLSAHVLMVVASVGIEALYQRYWWVIIGCTTMPALRVIRAEFVGHPDGILVETPEAT